MSDYRKQFVIRQDGKGRWRWSLYESGMKPVAEGRIAARSYEACVADALKVANLAATADIWDAERQAWVDGIPSPIYRTNVAFTGIPVSPGTHRIELLYVPRSFYVGLAVTALTLLCWIGWFALVA